MYGYLPKEYEELRESQNIVEREAEEINALNSEIKNVLDQFFIDTATWGLSNWERVCGIKTDTNKSYEERRSNIKSRLRGVGTVTTELIKNVAESYANGEVEVSENNTNYEINVKFVEDRGIPTRIEDVKRALRDIIPAHMGIVYSFTYMTWDELDAHAFTWDGLDTQALTWDEFETYGV